MFKSSSNFLTDRFNAVLLLWILFVIFVSCLSLSYCLDCSLQSWGHLLGKGKPFGSLVRDVFCAFVTLPYDVLCWEWYLIVSIPDLCLVPYFNYGLCHIYPSKMASKMTPVFSYLQ